ncbi:sigma 54-interacting transcriptional regulator [candidate division KSB1 bacterium]|nr:sigma 54-interacting transcriptional regulator [candidate division KSB1 bacterium]
MKNQTDQNYQTRTDVILDSIADGVFTVNCDWRITSFNRAAEQITGVPKDEAIGSTCRDVFHSNICDSQCLLKQSIQDGRPITNKSIYIINSNGEQVPISISAAPLKDKDGKVVGGIETFRDLSEVTELRKQLEQKYTFQDIISKNNAVQKIFDILPDVAVSDSTVLIQGESGSGKELFARAIHHLSRRGKKKMVVVNSGALPDTLLESELFGYKAGAFTDAKKSKPGRFALAEGSTIFLDEIGDISPAMQVRLLRVLQERVYEPLGATESVNADVRVIAATNKNLQQMVDEGTFRQDLFYRLNVVCIKLPLLRERKEDIPMLIDHFINRFNKLKRKQILDVSDEVLHVLINYDFPGNIRELENIIEYSFILCRGQTIQISHLPEKFQKQYTTLASKSSIGFSLAAIQKQAIEQALIRHKWKRLATAKELGIDKGTLRRMIERLGINEP